MKNTFENLVDEGFRISLVETAYFDGIHEIPRVEKNDKVIIPSGMVPFSLREQSENFEDFVCFYEHDIKFRSILTQTESFIEDLKRFPGVITPDCSLYIDSPLCAQILSVYLNRAVGHYLQSQGIYVIPNIRWGDERTYTTEFLGEKVAFLGVEKHSIVSVGTYGQIKRAEDKKYFKEGLEAMLDELEPEAVLVYGSMPDSIFGDFKNRTRFVQYQDWTTRKHNPSR